MREFLIRYFSRILAVLGCTTLVTACYGVPYEVYVPVKGKVIDAETARPVGGVQVKINVGNGVRGTTGVQASVPLGVPISTHTDRNGYFSATVEAYDNPDAVMLEVLDVDGEDNGCYMPGAMVTEYVEGDIIVMKMEQAD